MRRELLKILRCPCCSSEKLALSVKEGNSKNIKNGWVKCPTCKKKFLVKNYIPILLTNKKLIGFKKENEEYPLEKVKRIAQIIKSRQGHLNLDAGCGKGVYLDLYNSNRVVGCDLNFSLLSEAAASIDTEKIDLICCDVRNLPLRSKIFDFSISSEVVEHLDVKDHQHFIKGLERITKKWLVIDTMNSGSFIEWVKKFLSKNLGFYKGQRGFAGLSYELDHHSALTSSFFKKYGFKIRGCLGFVTRKELEKIPGGRIISFLYDALAWRFPIIAGTLIGIKKI